MEWPTSVGGTLGTADLTPLSLWSPQGSRIRGVTAHPTICTTLAVEPRSQLLITGGSDGKVLLWDDLLTEVGPTLANHTPMVTSIAVSPDGVVATAGGDGHIQLHDFRDTTLLDRAARRLHSKLQD